MKTTLKGKMDGHTGELMAVATAPELENIAAVIVDIIDSVPRTYRVMFPLPMIDVRNDVEFSDEVSIVRTPKVKNQFGALAKAFLYAPRPDTSYLSVVARGYVSGLFSQSGMKDAASVMKRVLEVGVSKNAFETVAPASAPGGLFGYPSEEILQAVVYDAGVKEGTPITVLLPLGISARLRRLALYDGTRGGPALTPSRIDPNTREKDLEKLISLSVRVVTGSKTEAQTRSVRSALEWAFDADADEDETIAFIKTCIALEAVLGEESESDQLTERLADRCAYLLADVPPHRSNVRTKIKQIYKLRSKLVHGVKTRLDHSDHDLDFWARVQLKMALDRELMSLVEWLGPQDRA